MINRRILINLGAFLLLFAILTGWAVLNVLKFDFIERPFKVTAFFETSPGLRDGFEVTYLGLRVGEIGAVALVDDGALCRTDQDEAAGGCVEVELKIDRGAEIPANVTAAVSRKSAVGEPYVDLTVPEDEATSTAILEPGALLKDGTVPLAYSDLFEALNDLVQAIPPDAVETLVHELAAGLEGRSEDIRRLLEGADDLTATFAADPAFLADLTEQLTTLTHTLAEHRGSIGSTIDNFALFSEALAANRDAIVAVLDRTPRFAGQVADLLDAAGGDLTCALRSLSVTTGGLTSDATLADVNELLDVAMETGQVLQDSIHDEADGPWIHGPLQLGGPLNGGAPVPIYATPPVLPNPPALETCHIALPAAAGAGGADDTGAGGTASPRAGSTPAEDTDRPTAARDAIADSTDDKTSNDNLITQLLPVVGLLLVAAMIGYLLYRLARRRTA
jgi:phospholipid/cholesterol/gamma-HCH transport system substrate-binding protein